MELFLWVLVLRVGKTGFNLDQAVHERPISDTVSRILGSAGIYYRRLRAFENGSHLNIALKTVVRAKVTRYAWTNRHCGLSIAPPKRRSRCW